MKFTIKKERFSMNLDIYRVLYNDKSCCSFMDLIKVKSFIDACMRHEIYSRQDWYEKATKEMKDNYLFYSGQMSGGILELCPFLE